MTSERVAVGCDRGLTEVAHRPGKKQKCGSADFSDLSEDIANVIQWANDVVDIGNPRDLWHVGKRLKAIIDSEADQLDKDTAADIFFLWGTALSRLAALDDDVTLGEAAADKFKEMSELVGMENIGAAAISLWGSSLLVVGFGRADVATVKDALRLLRLAVDQTDGNSFETTFQLAKALKETIEWQAEQLSMAAKEVDNLGLTSAELLSEVEELLDLLLSWNERTLADEKQDSKPSASCVQDDMALPKQLAGDNDLREQRSSDVKTDTTEDAEDAALHEEVDSEDVADAWLMKAQILVASKLKASPKGSKAEEIIIHSEAALKALDRADELAPGRPACALEYVKVFREHRRHSSDEELDETTRELLVLADNKLRAALEISFGLSCKMSEKDMERIRRVCESDGLIPDSRDKVAPKDALQQCEAVKEPRPEPAEESTLPEDEVDLESLSKVVADLGQLSRLKSSFCPAESRQMHIAEANRLLNFAEELNEGCALFELALLALETGDIEQTSQQLGRCIEILEMDGPNTSVEVLPKGWEDAPELKPCRNETWMKDLMKSAHRLRDYGSTSFDDQTQEGILGEGQGASSENRSVS